MTINPTEAAVLAVALDQIKDALCKQVAEGNEATYSLAMGKLTDLQITLINHADSADPIRGKTVPELVREWTYSNV